MRMLQLEGSLISIRRMHFMVQQVLNDAPPNTTEYDAYVVAAAAVKQAQGGQSQWQQSPVAAATPAAATPYSGGGSAGGYSGNTASYGAAGGGGAGVYGPGAATGGAAAGYSTGGGGYAAAAAAAPVQSAVPMGGIPLNSLSMRGVHAEAVRQLMDLRNYLSVYSLDLMVVEAGRMPQTTGAAGGHMIPAQGMQIQGQGQYSGSPQGHTRQTEWDRGGDTRGGSNGHAGGGGGGRSQHREHDPNQKSLEFAIPTEKAGVIIGKSASVLKALQKEFGIFICIEKEGHNGMRTVMLRGEEESTLFRARDRITVMLSEHAGQVPTATEEMSTVAHTGSVNTHTGTDVEAETAGLGVEIDGGGDITGGRTGNENENGAAEGNNQ
mmetsp:Transcript_15528/g.15660  ORF Transcript_15528/g.15660 Transcript_15528/m.15660 type:complete len:380 (-) Transcript_15528:62-1201(-)